MVPLSVDRGLALGQGSMDATRRETRWHPANIPFFISAETRALALWICLFLLSSVPVALGYVWVRLRVVEVGYRLSAIQQLLGRLEQEERELTIEAATAGTPGRLEQELRSRLGLQRPDRDQYAVLP